MHNIGQTSYILFAFFTYIVIETKCFEILYIYVVITIDMSSLLIFYKFFLYKTIVLIPSPHRVFLS